MTDESGSEDDKGGERPDSQNQEPVEISTKTDPPPALPMITLVKEALPLIGFLLLPAFALRALVTARFDLTVATALVQFTQPLSFALSFLLDTVPIFIYTIGVVVMFRAGKRLQPGTKWYFFGRGRTLLVIGALVFGLVTNVPLLMTAPDLFYLLFPGITLVSFMVGHRERLECDVKAPVRLMPNVRAEAAGLLSFVILTFGIFQGMWLAPEILTIQGKPKLQYVLQQQDKDLIVYNPGLHAVIRVPVADVSYRQFCNSRSFTVAERLFDSPQGRPPCPK